MTVSDPQKLNSLEAVRDRIGIVSEFARTIRPLGPANFLYWDGDAMFAHGHRRHQPDGGDIRPPGLYSLCRTCSAEPSTPDIEGMSVIPMTGEQHVFLVASVPLTDENWQPLGDGEILVISQGISRARIPATPPGSETRYESANDATP